MGTSTIVLSGQVDRKGQAHLAAPVGRDMGGALLGLIVGGIGVRLAMMLIAKLNPNAIGTVSDDGFVIGHLTFQSLGLLALATLLGVLDRGHLLRAP
jgi:hypothetical protein